MVMDPNTGQGFPAVEVDQADYYDPNATNDAFPGVVGLQMRVHTFWQGNVEFNTFEALGPTDQSIFTSESQPSGVTGPTSTTISEGSRFNPDFVPLIGTSEFAIVVELHGAYGFPLASDENDPTLAYNTVCKFPITPEKLGPQFPTNNHWSQELVGSGEILIRGNETLETISWDSFWPVDYDDTFMCVTEADFTAMGAPKQVIANLIWTKRWSLPCRLVIGDPGIFNDYVVIADFSYSHTFGSAEDYDYTIGFKRLKSTTITSVPNPDADIDHFSQIPLINQPGITAGILSPATSVSSVTTQPGFVELPSPPIADASTVFPDVSSARSAQSASLVQNPIVDAIVYDITNQKAWGGGSLVPWDFAKGETLNDVSLRIVGRVWNDDQRALNPDFKDTDPDQHLGIGTHIKIMLYGPQEYNQPQPQNPYDPTKIFPSLGF